VPHARTDAPPPKRKRKRPPAPPQQTGQTWTRAQELASHGHDTPPNEPAPTYGPGRISPPTSTLDRILAVGAGPLDSPRRQDRHPADASPSATPNDSAAVPARRADNAGAWRVPEHLRAPRTDSRTARDASDARTRNGRSSPGAVRALPHGRRHAGRPPQACERARRWRYRRPSEPRPRDRFRIRSAYAQHRWVPADGTHRAARLAATTPPSARALLRTPDREAPPPARQPDRPRHRPILVRRPYALRLVLERPQEPSARRRRDAALRVPGRVRSGARREPSPTWRYRTGTRDRGAAA
jgi:hypothetical protein